MSALAELAPPGAVLVAIADEGQQILLHPAEAVLVAHAAPKRRRDFALGRACAHGALARLGKPDAVVGRAASGAPLWPEGMVGSITHTRGFAAALAGQAGAFAAMGIDAERTGGMDDALAPRLFVASELALLSGLEAPGRRAAATLLFSAKEAYYKLVHPLTGRRLGFRQVEIALGDGIFRAHQPEASDDWRTPLEGCFAVIGDLVVTVICIAPDAVPE
jgi:4'-phosphopantetheinyl transferase EntD